VQHPNNASEAMPPRDRKILLDGPSVLLIVSHSGTPFDYAHQRSAAKGIVSADRIRQLQEESDSNHRPCIIEIPVRALSAASEAFRHAYDASPDHARIPLDVGNILPGYVMCVLDWIVRSLRIKTPIAFIPELPVIDGEDKWYWVYCYTIMCCLGMEHAGELQHFIILLVDHEGLVAESVSYIRLLRALQPSDPIVAHVAERTARQMAANTLGLSAAQCQDISAQYPQFAKLVNGSFTKI
jgi:hypothetical protein